MFFSKQFLNIFCQLSRVCAFQTTAESVFQSFGRWFRKQRRRHEGPCLLPIDSATNASLLLPQSIDLLALLCPHALLLKVITEAMQNSAKVSMLSQILMRVADICVDDQQSSPLFATVLVVLQSNSHRRALASPGAKRNLIELLRLLLEHSHADAMPKVKNGALQAPRHVWLGRT